MECLKVSVVRKQDSSMDRSFSRKFFARSPKIAGLRPRFLRLLSEDRSVQFFLKKIVPSLFCHEMAGGGKIAQKQNMKEGRPR